MSRNLKKKQTEQRALAAARKAGAPIPTGELAAEGPDFRFLTPYGVLGIEVSELLRPASSNHGISPVEAEAFHQSILLLGDHLKTGQRLSVQNRPTERSGNVNVVLALLA